jgi:hypothetical protein
MLYVCIIFILYSNLVFLGYAYDVVHYYSSCEGEGPLFKPIDDALEYNSVMNSTYFAMLNDNPLLSASCRLGVSSVGTDM